jgi:hypothetical protein
VATMMMAVLTLFAIAGSIQTPSSQFSAAGIDDPKMVDMFLSDLQQAVAADDAAKVAELARYPVDVVVGKKRRRLRTRDEMQKLYPDVFTPCLKKIVAAARPEDLFASYQGVMIGGGAIWFGLQGSRRMLFYTINGPQEGDPVCSATPQ